MAKEAAYIFSLYVRYVPALFINAIWITLIIHPNYYGIFIVPIIIVVLLITYFLIFCLVGLKIEDGKIYVMTFFRWRQIQPENIRDVVQFAGGLRINVEKGNLLKAYFIHFLSPMDINRLTGKINRIVRDWNDENR